jgi:chromosome segregation ATPase
VKKKHLLASLDRKTHYIAHLRKLLRETKLRHITDLELARAGRTYESVVRHVLDSANEGIFDLERENRRLKIENIQLEDHLEAIKQDFENVERWHREDMQTYEESRRYLEDTNRKLQRQILELEEKIAQAERYQGEKEEISEYLFSAQEQIILLREKLDDFAHTHVSHTEGDDIPF